MSGARGQSFVNDPRFNIRNRSTVHMFLQLQEQNAHKNHLNNINAGKNFAKSILNEQICH